LAFSATNNCPATTDSINRTWGGGVDAVTYNGVTVPGSVAGTPRPIVWVSLLEAAGQSDAPT